MLRYGAKVYLLRSRDSNPSLSQRVRKTNQYKADFFVSVHINSFINESANGTETYYYKPIDKKAARFVQSELVKSLNLRKNSEVLIPAMTYCSTAFAVIEANLKPILKFFIF